MALIFPESFLQEVMDRNDIVDIASRFVSLKRSGGTLKGLCPFHKEKTPSFTVSPDKQLYYCFGCGRGGNIIGFVKDIENLDFVEAVKYLAEQAGMDIPDTNEGGAANNAKLRRTIYKINSLSGRFFYECLHSPEGEEALEYIMRRGISQAAVNRFGLGYAPELNKLLDYLRNQGFTDDEIIESGMAVKNERGDVYDRFRNRLMFPIIDVRKNIIGFGGRVLDDGIPKYLNSPETAAFSKSYNLFGLNLAKSTKDNYLILVEGYMDVISLHQNGIDSAVATLGTALTPQQARIIKRMKPEVIIAYDSDEAGQKATQKAIELLAEEDLTVKVLTMGDGEDPDDYIKKNGVGAFRELVDNAKLQIEYKISKLQEQYNLDIVEDKIKYINELALQFAKIKSPVEREIYVKKVAQETGVSADSIFSEISRLNVISERKSRIDGFKGQPSIGAIRSLNPKKENALRGQRLALSLICSDKRAADLAMENLIESDFDEGLHRELFNLLMGIWRNGHTPDARIIVSQFEDSANVSRILHDDQNIEDKLLAMEELIRFFADERKKRNLLDTLLNKKASQEQTLNTTNKMFEKGGRDQ
ncbi:MAG: DNA primase [Eubacteriales bacterium]|jgi:DNA primase|nr:DNA primase [Eubacteriales bacterium]